MPAQLNCIFTKGLIPWVERTVGSDGVAAVLRAAGRSRDYLMAEYNFIPFPTADQIVRLCMEMMGEPDEDRWARRFAEDFMDWKPSRQERGWAGAYTMSLGSPRAIFADTANQATTFGWARLERLSMSRRRALFRLTPDPDLQRVPRWVCTWNRVCYERYPTNWRLPRARITELACAARGDAACLWDARWRNPPFGARFWGPTAAGVAGAAALGVALVATQPPWWLLVAVGPLPLAAGTALGAALLQWARRRHFQRMLRVQADEILYSSRELEKKFRDLEAKVEQLSLLIELSAAVNATLDPEKIYEQALERLVNQMGYQRAFLFLVDRERQALRGHRAAGDDPDATATFESLELPLDPSASASARAATTGLPVLVNDVDAATEPLHRETIRTFNVRGFVAVPLRVKGRVFGVLTVTSREPDRFAEPDVELLSAVANHVALAVDRAESFQTIEDLTRNLEDKVRVRTEQLRAAHEELQAAYRNLQMTQMQLIQREKMASVGQLVAGVAHELNNPIGFVYSNVTTLEDFVRRLRTMLEAYQAAPLPEAERARLDREREGLKVDYALRYLDAMIHGIREGAERARKIVRDLRVFARSEDDVWQPVDLHEELESSLTLLNHLLKDRVTVHRKFGDLPSVECVRSQIDQVFLNLLANAAQAIPGRGEITIETRREDDVAVVTVADTGPGIPPDILGRIFDPFFTTKPVGEGTGLGLSISYEIVKKHGGEIRAASAPGRGATFTVRIPVARPAPR
jgi:signal transduction histidine kinase